MKKFGLVACLSLFLSGCATPSAAGASEKCLFEPTKDVTRTVEFAGTEVGFCCKKCEGKFNDMTDDAKQAALAKRK